jgi:Flp pilus assembly protein TadD
MTSASLRSPLTVVLTLVALAGCAPRHVEISEPSITETPEGRNRVRLDLAEALLDSGKSGEAQQVLQLALGEGADKDEVALLQGRALLLDGLATEATALFEQARKGMPHDPRPLRFLAVIHADRHEVPEAIALLVEATKIDPNDAASWNNLGFLQLSQQDYDAARASCSRAVALDGVNSKYRMNLGYALVASGHEADALQAFRSAGDEAEAQTNLAIALELGGKSDEAIVHYQKALQSNPNQSSARAGLTRLQTPSEAP